MPVDDHPVHERTKIDDSFRYGCHNREAFSKGYYAPDRRYFAGGSFDIVSKFINYKLSRDCKYDLSVTDPACSGCKWRDK